MEFTTSLLGMCFIITVIFLPIIGILKLLSNINSRPNIPRQELCEREVTDALRSLDIKSYVIFENLILPSRGNTAHTEIDQVVVSPYGIFCIETKSHQGTIYGYTKSKNWKQYLGGKEFNLHNPLHQNYKHTHAVADLLGSSLKAKVHAYVVFPNARSVTIDGERVDYSIDEVKRKIGRHKSLVYNLQDCETILKMLAVASSKREDLKNLHVAEVRAYLGGKIA
jgi:hypothetical protein